METNHILKVCLEMGDDAMDISAMPFYDFVVSDAAYDKAVFHEIEQALLASCGGTAKESKERKAWLFWKDLTDHKTWD